MLVAVLLAASTGLAIGAVVATAYLRRTTPAGPTTPAMPLTNLTDASVVRDAVGQLKIGVVLVDVDDTVTYSNSAATELNGTHAGLIVNDNLTQLIESVRAGGAGSREVVLHGPPRQILVIEAKPLPRGGMVATIQDVSERALIDSMRKDFVANISHELKTPVGAIAVLAETLVGETDPTTVGSLSARLVDEAHRAVRTIDDLLELSAIESNRPARDIVDLGEVVELAVARGRTLAHGRGIEISAQDGAAAPVRGDRRQLVSALGNLVENAVKYSHDGGAVLVGVRVDDPWIELWVADQGVGIPERDLDRIFERFYRVDKARGRDTGGTGLGLSIVRHVAQNHGGDVAVQSQEGDGATFVVRLPTGLMEQQRNGTDEAFARGAGDRHG